MSNKKKVKKENSFSSYAILGDLQRRPPPQGALHNRILISASDESSLNLPYYQSNIYKMLHSSSFQTLPVLGVIPAR